MRVLVIADPHIPIPHMMPSLQSKRVLVILPSLCAEGTPVLVLEMCRQWLTWGIEPLVVTLSPTPDDLASEFQALEIPVESWGLGNHGYKRYAQMVSNTYALCRQFHPAAVLSMPVGWHTFFAYGAYLAGVRQIAAHVGNYPPYWAGNAFRKFRWEVQLGRPVTNKLICCSHYTRTGVIQKFGVSDRETITIYNGCPVERLIPDQPLQHSKKGDRFTIGMVARLEIHKDQPTLIRAAYLLKQRGISVQVLLIGEGSRRAEYEALIQEQNVEDCVHLLGVRRDIPALLRQLDLFVFSAKPDEGFGVALIEAMAAGVPVVATDVGACREVLDDGQLGLLMPAENPQRMADAICTIMAHPHAAHDRAAKAQEKVLREFTIARMAKEYAHCLTLIP